MNLKRWIAAGVTSALVIALVVVTAFSDANVGDYVFDPDVDVFTNLSTAPTVSNNTYIWAADIDYSSIKIAASTTQITHSDLKKYVTAYAENPSMKATIDFNDTPPVGATARFSIEQQYIQQSFSNEKIGLKIGSLDQVSGDHSITYTVPERPGSLTGIGEKMSESMTLTLGEDSKKVTYSLNKNHFTYSATGSYYEIIDNSPKKFEDKDIRARVVSFDNVSGQTGGFSADLIYAGITTPQLQITTPSTALTAGAHTIVVELYSNKSNSGFTNANFATINLTVKEPASTDYPIQGAGTPITRTLSMADSSTGRGYELTNGMFKFRDNYTAGISLAALNESYYTLTSTDNYNGDGVVVLDKGTNDVNKYFTARIQEESSNSSGVKTPHVVVFANSSTPSGTYNLSVWLVKNIAAPTRPSIELAQLTITYGTVVAPTKITGIDTSSTYTFTPGKNGSDLSGSESITSLDIIPGDRVTLTFTTDAFTWEGDTKPNPVRSIKGITNANNVKAEVQRNNKDRDLLEKTTLDIKHADATTGYPYGYSYIEMNFKVPFVSTKDRDFSITVELKYGSSSSTQTVTIEGTLSNEVVYAYGGERTIDVSGGNGYIIDVDGSINNATISLDDGIDLKTSLRRGLYYAYVDTEEDDDDTDVMDRYRDIQRVYNLYTIGLNGSDTTIDLNEGASYHIYNKNLDYLGTGSDIRKLPYSTKYYVSNRKLDINDDNDNVPTVTDPVIETPIGTTPGVTSPVNENANPTTGR